MYVYGACLFYVCCSDCVGVCGNVCCVAAIVKDIYYRFIVGFPIGLNFLFFFVDLKFCHIRFYTIMSFLVFQPVFCFQLYTPYISLPSPHHMSIPSQSTTSRAPLHAYNNKIFDYLYEHYYYFIVALHISI